MTKDDSKFHDNLVAARHNTLRYLEELYDLADRREDDVLKEMIYGFADSLADLSMLEALMLGERFGFEYKETRKEINERVQAKLSDLARDGYNCVEWR